MEGFDTVVIFITAVRLFVIIILLVIVIPMSVRSRVLALVAATVQLQAHLQRTAASGDRALEAEQQND